jgi:nucleoside-diphosphate-sugar epimerase
MLGDRHYPSSAPATKPGDDRAITERERVYRKPSRSRFGDAGWGVRELVRRDIELGGFIRTVVGASSSRSRRNAAPSSKQLHDSNVTLTAKMVAAAREARVGRFVFVSSLAAVGPATSLETSIDEATTPAPLEAYGRTKLDAEHVVRQASDLPFVIVRPAAVYGPGDRDFLALFRLARLGVALHAANRDHWLSIIHVADLADAIVRSATHPRRWGASALATTGPCSEAALPSRRAVCKPRVERRHRDSIVPGRRRRRDWRRRRAMTGRLGCSPRRR